MTKMILTHHKEVSLKDSKPLIHFKLPAMIFVLLFVLASVVWAQEIEWIRQFGGIGPAEDLAEAVDANGNIYIVGKTDGSLPNQSSAGEADAFVRKYDPNGNELWTRQFGTAANDYTNGISIDASGVYVAGYTDGTLPGQSSFGDRDAFVRKYDSDGTELWTLQFGTELEDQARSISVDATGIYVCGYTYDALPGQTSAGATDAFVRKYDLNGTELWTSQFGSAANDYTYGISVDVTGVYVSGYTYGALPGQSSAGDRDAFVRKYDFSGAVLWTRQFGTAFYDYAYGITTDGTGIYIVGSTNGALGQTNFGSNDAFVRKYDAAGNEQWTHQSGTTSSDYAYGISVDASGVYIAGNTYGTFLYQTNAGGSDAFVLKSDLNNGNELWIRQFGTITSDYASGISVDATGIYVAGYTYGTLPGQTSAGDYDAFARKYDSGGNELWTRQFGSDGPSEDVYTSITVDGNIYTAGRTYGTLAGQTSAGLSDAFVRIYDANGTVLWTCQFGTVSDDYVNGIAVDATGMYVAGYTYGTFPGQTRAGRYDVFVRKYDFNGTELWTRQFGTTTYDYAYGISVDAAGVYVAGATNGILPGQTRVGDYDAFVRKYDLNGTEQWTRQFGTTSKDYVNGISVDATGAYVAGHTNGALPNQTSAGGYDAFVRKYDSNGNAIWTNQFGTTLGDYAYGISVDASAVCVSGYTEDTLPGQTSASGIDAFVRTYDLNGAELWTRQFGTTSSDYAYGISVDATGVCVVGYTDGALPGQANSGYTDAFVRKYDLSGSELWTCQFGTVSFDYAGGISGDATGAYVAGHTYGTFPGQTSAGGYDAFVAKLGQGNKPPVVEANGPYSVDEGGSVAVTASGSDPDNDPLTFDWDLNNDGLFETSGQSVTFSAAGLDGPSSQIIAVKVTDSGGLFVTDQTTVEILNDVPIAGEISAPIDPVPVNTVISVSANFTDPGVPDTHTATWEWGDGSSSPGTVQEANGSGTVTGSHIYTVAGSYSITLTIADDEGGTSQPVFQPIVIFIPNEPPVVEAGGPFNATEGGSVIVTAIGSDPDNDPINFAWDLDNDGLFETPGQSVTFSAAGLDGPGIKTIVAKVTDSGGLFATDQATVQILNAAPTAGGIIALIDPVPVNTVINFSANFTDPGVPDIHTANWNWGDGSSSPGTVDEASGSGTVAGSHSYATAGVYTDTLIVWDDDGESDTSVFHYTVVFDPGAGYVTGAGWIDSPPGAYTPDPSLTGKAKFGFESKYKKGQSIPDGNTKFSFKTADLKFESTSYDWLVIAGPHAKYKGSGTIDDSGNYGFLLTAIDGQVNGGGGIDKFRIKIWEKATAQVVYDNQLGDPDDGEATDAIEAGNIVIHKEAGLPKPDNFAEDIEPEAKPKQFALFQNYPNPFNPETMIRFQLPQANYVVVRIFNTLGAEIRKLVNGQYDAGDYSVIWDARDNSGNAVSSGIYVYQIQVEQYVAVKRMVLIRQHLIRTINNCQYRRKPPDLMLAVFFAYPSFSPF